MSQRGRSVAMPGPVPAVVAPAIVIIGVSGSGKSSVGEALAAALHLPFLEGDSMHSPASLAKMHAGIALTDQDRQPWLDSIAAWMVGQPARHGCVVACSALRRRYRDHLRSAVPTLQLVALTVAPDLLADRMRERQHFMPPSLLASQLATWEPPDKDEHAISIDASDDLAAVVERVRQTLSP
ncbi:MAG: gluconokinase [Rhodanobacter sp.]